MDSHNGLENTGYAVLFMAQVPNCYIYTSIGMADF